MKNMAEEIKTKINHEKWFDENIKIYESLAANVANTLKTALDKNNIMYVDIPYRAKTRESFLKKWGDKKYQATDQVMDLAGIRIITLVEDDLNAVEGLIRKLFCVHEEDSGDKSIHLGHEKFGYRSRHFICDIGPKREALIELDHFKGMKFEIQIRTALAHAWAEIEHDRGYKLEGGLPEKFKRRLNIVAAMLEGADNEFNRLTQEINDYTKSMELKFANNDLDVEISRIGIQTLLSKKYSSYIQEKNFNLDKDFINIKNELDYFDIKDIRVLDGIIQEVLSKGAEIEKLFKEHYPDQTEPGFIRDVLMLYDLDRYTKMPPIWGGLDYSLYKILLTQYEPKMVESLIEVTGVEWG